LDKSLVFINALHFTPCQGRLYGLIRELDPTIFKGAVRVLDMNVNETVVSHPTSRKKFGQARGRKGISRSEVISSEQVDKGVRQMAKKVIGLMPHLGDI